MVLAAGAPAAGRVQPGSEARPGLASPRRPEAELLLTEPLLWAEQFPQKEIRRENQKEQEACCLQTGSWASWAGQAARSPGPVPRPPPPVVFKVP